jgi:hypothetical protein
VGVLPLAHVKSMLFGNSLTSLPFAVYGGVVADDDEAARAGAEAQRLARSWACTTWNCATSSARHPDWPEQDLYVTFRKAILPEEEANMLAIPRKQRAMVRKGIKNGLERDRRRRGPLLRAVCRQRAPPRHAGHAQALLPGAAREFGADCEVLTVTGPTAACSAA